MLCSLLPNFIFLCSLCPPGGRILQISPHLDNLGLPWQELTHVACVLFHAKSHLDWWVVSPSPLQAMNRKFDRIWNFGFHTHPLTDRGKTSHEIVNLYGILLHSKFQLRRCIVSPIRLKFDRFWNICVLPSQIGSGDIWKYAIPCQNSHSLMHRVAPLWGDMQLFWSNFDQGEVWRARIKFHLDLLTVSPWGRKKNKI